MTHRLLGTAYRLICSSGICWWRREGTILAMTSAPLLELLSPESWQPCRSSLKTRSAFDNTSRHWFTCGSDKPWTWALIASTSADASATADWGTCFCGESQVGGPLAPTLFVVLPNPSGGGFTAFGGAWGDAPDGAYGPPYFLLFMQIFVIIGISYVCCMLAVFFS